MTGTRGCTAIFMTTVDSWGLRSLANLSRPSPPLTRTRLQVNRSATACWVPGGVVVAVW